MARSRQTWNRIIESYYSCSYIVLMQGSQVLSFHGQIRPLETPQWSFCLAVVLSVIMLMNTIFFIQSLYNLYTIFSRGAISFSRDPSRLASLSCLLKSDPPCHHRLRHRQPRLPSVAAATRTVTVLSYSALAASGEFSMQVRPILPYLLR